MAWHGDASLLIPDPYAADAGVNVYGSSRGWGCYVIDDAEWGLLGYGCDVTPAAASEAAAAGTPRPFPRAEDGPVDISPTDPLHRSLYIAPLGLLLRTDSLPLEGATLDLRRSGGAPSLALRFNTSGGAAACPGLWTAARLEASVPVAASLASIGNLTVTWPVPAPPLERGAYELPCASAAGGMTFSWSWPPTMAL